MSKYSIANLQVGNTPCDTLDCTAVMPARDQRLDLQIVQEAARDKGTTCDFLKGSVQCAVCDLDQYFAFLGRWFRNFLDFSRRFINQGNNVHHHDQLLLFIFLLWSFENCEHYFISFSSRAWFQSLSAQHYTVHKIDPCTSIQFDHERLYGSSIVQDQMSFFTEQIQRKKNNK
mmetsp:Transcript_28762/g.69251  ORF Transcript_28762/g.69251 Transcript_28762/m.69251 type:complete len:173 (+) Transcript_28762:864-1382(+)